MTLTKKPLPPLPEIDDVTRREFLIGAAGLLVLAPYGCGGETGQGGQNNSDDARTVEHAGGVTEVPRNPQRVATFSEGIASHLVSVGLLPVAANESTPDWLRPYRELYDEDLQISEIRTVGTSEEPNLERLASIGPDLILIETYTDEGLWDRLAEIAPTVVIFRGDLDKYGEVEPSNAGWKQAFDQTVRAVGRQEEAEQWRRRYQDQVASTEEVSEGVSVSFIRPDEGGTFRLDGTGAFGGSVAAEAGFQVTDAPDGVGEEVSDGGWVTISGERLDVADGDIIAAPEFPGEKPAVETFESRNPLWQKLPAVEAGRVLSLPGQIYNGGTYAYATTLLRELQKNLG